MQIQLSDHFSYKKLLKFTFSPIIMMIFTSIYGVVDGIFVSNFVGATAFTALNFIYPYIMVLGAFGFMFGSGGSALIGKYLGEGEPDKANKAFSLVVYTSLALGAVLSLFGILTVRPVAMLMGATGQMLEDCVLYATVSFIALPALLIQFEFQTLFVTAEKPKLGLYVTVASGITNMVLDALLIAVFSLGLVGAAAATALSQIVAATLSLVYFGRKNSSLLRLTKTKLELYPLCKTCTNGISELLSNIAMSFVGMLYNVQLMAYAGEAGVAAYGVLMYVNFVFLSTFIGYVVGISPVVSYHFGAANKDELKSLLKKSITLILIASAAMFILAELLAYPLSFIFVSYDTELLALTTRGFFIFSFCFLFSGIGILGSSFFTALNDGLTSAVISFLRTIVFQVAAIILLPLVLKVDGIWLSCVVAELLSAIVTVIYLALKRKKYGY